MAHTARSVTATPVRLEKAPPTPVSTLVSQWPSCRCATYGRAWWGRVVGLADRPIPGSRVPLHRRAGPRRRPVPVPARPSSAGRPSARRAAGRYRPRRRCAARPPTRRPGRSRPRRRGGCRRYPGRASVRRSTRARRSARPACRTGRPVAELRALASSRTHITLADYLHDTGLEGTDIYTGNHSWSAMREASGLPVAPAAAWPGCWSPISPTRR